MFVIPAFTPPVVGGYQISRSIRLRASASASLTRTPGGAGNRTVWTWSGWVKRGTIGVRQAIFAAYVDANNVADIEFTVGDAIQVLNYVGGVMKTQKVTTAVYRDPSAWMHILVSSNGATALNIYVNGVQVTTFTTNTGPDASNWAFNAAAAHAFGQTGAATLYFDGYFSDIYFIDGQALAASSFGEFDGATGVWSPKTPSGLTYGANGFHLTFANNSAATAAALGADTSGNGNNWTPTNISVTAGVTNDSLVDTPTNYGTDTGAGGEVRGNYATLNPLDLWEKTNGSAAVLSEGNFKAADTLNGPHAVTGTVFITGGKWYFETLVSTNSLEWIGVVKTPTPISGTSYDSANAYSYRNDGTKNNNASSTSYGATYTTNDVIGVALDLDAGTLVFYKNNVSQGAAFSGLSGTFAVFGCVWGAALTFNFGQRPFAYAAPSGFKALCTQNLPTPAVLKSSDYFDVHTRAGTGAATTISGKPFAPDLVWSKSRSNAYTHKIFDRVRGAGNVLNSSATTAEVSDITLLSAFNTDGYTLGADAGITGAGATFVEWLWKEGATPGFDIVTYTGTGAAKIENHSLGAVPKFIIVKQRNGAATDWMTYHAALGADYYVSPNTTAAKAGPAAGSWNSTIPTTSVFSLGIGGYVNTVGQTYVAYLWAEVPGFSKFGSYVGNGAADGPFVWCGFRPRFILIKDTNTAATNWVIHDTAREPYNLAQSLLYANLPDAEGSAANEIDILSNGFKVRRLGQSVNQSTDTYIFAAFAEAPFKTARAR